MLLNSNAFFPMQKNNQEKWQTYGIPQQGTVASKFFSWE